MRLTRQDQMHMPHICRSTVLLLLSCLGMFLGGCLPDFNLSGRDRCFSNEDCLNGRACDLSAPDADGTGVCVDSMTQPIPDPPPDPEACQEADQDNDGTSALAGCGPLDCDDNNERRSPLLPEFCDGIDNDCDGLIDEGQRNTCGQCDPQPEETCDGRDNDCDGAIDDGVTNACGGCGPAPDEICDLDDNDCDGLVDEGIEASCACEAGDTRPCLPNAPEVCNTGQQSCDQGRWGTCRGAVLAAPEVCDGQDNDCDDQIDEGFDLNDDPSHCGACGVVCGSFQAERSCVDGQCQLTCARHYFDLDGDHRNGCEYGCVPTSNEEFCSDGLDNDCDGRVDDGCALVGFNGVWHYFNLFGRSTPGFPPGLLTGRMAITDPQELVATFSELTLYAEDLNAGRFEFERTSTRTLTLNNDGALSITPQNSDDPLGGVFRGQITADRRVAALIEYNNNAQAASIALLVKVPFTELPTSPTTAHGPYNLVHAAPTEPLRVPTARGATVARMGFEPANERAQLLALLGDGFEVQASQDYTIDLGGLMTIADPDDAVSLFGPVTTRGDLAVLTRRRQGTAQDEAPLTLPELALMIERGRSPASLLADGQWTLFGIQTARLGDDDHLSYNVVAQPLRLERADDRGQRILVDTDDGIREAGRLTIQSNAYGPELTVTLNINDNLQPPTLWLRGHATAQDDVAVFWEVDADGASIPRSSLFIAIRHTGNGTP